MNDYVRTIPVGFATVTVINVGNVILTLSEIMNVSEGEWRPRYTADFAQPFVFPSQCIHIALPGASVLVMPTIMLFLPRQAHHMLRRITSHRQA